MVQRSILARIFAPALLALAALSTSATAETSKELLSASIDEVPAYLETLKALVLTESGSRDADGLAAVADQLEMHLTELGFTTERHPSTAADGAGADTVVGVKFGTGRQKVLLMAHMDTVYEKGILETEPYREDGNLIYGPGIVDAKGGIAMILHTLRVLDRIGWDDYATMTVSFNPDEEIGSPGSGDLIAALGAEADTVLSFEPTWAGAPGDYLLFGTATYARFRLEVRGRASHAGTAPKSGRNAVVELAHQILQTKDLAEKVPGAQLSWTNVIADQAFNQIPETAVAIGDGRITIPGAAQELQKVLQETVDANPLIKGTTTTVSFEILNPGLYPNEASLALAEVAKEVYRDLGKSNVMVLRMIKGTTDAAYAGRDGDAAVLEGMGPTGDNYHASGEYIEVDSIPRRLAFVTQLLIELGR